jgi:septal ring factor EnvC (AmiA/AmiB activator)
MKWKVQIIVVCALIGLVGLAMNRASHKRQIAQMNAKIEAQAKELESLHKQLESTQAEIKSISDYCRRVEEIKINYSEARHEIDEANQNSEVKAWSGAAVPDALCRVLNERLCDHTQPTN